MGGKKGEKKRKWRTNKEETKRTIKMLRFDQYLEDFIHIFVEPQSHTLKISNYMQT